jgi:hypothetical protein
MKAIVFRYLFVALAAVLFLIIAFGIYDVSAKMFEDKSLELLRRFKTYKPYVFNINDLIVDPNDPNATDATQQNKYYTSGSDPTFCKDVRNCIETNIKGGEPCLITYKVKPGTPFNINSFKNALENCPSTTIKEELYGNTQRKICEFKPITNYNELREDNLSIIDYEPYLHNCYLPDNLGSLNVLNDVDSINYLYSGRGTKDDYSFENGGIVRIVVTNVSLKKDFATTCSYSLYVCGQNSIGTKVDETTVQVFKKVQNLDERELYFNETVYWGSPTPEMPDGLTIDTTMALVSPVFWAIYTILNIFSAPSPPTINNLYGYYPRFYDFTFKSLVPNKEKALIDAVDAGMWEWNKINYINKDIIKHFLNIEPDLKYIYFSYSPIEENHILEDNIISANSGCWNTDYEKNNAYNRLGIDTGNLQNSDSLKHYFMLNKINTLVDGKKINMTLGLKKIFIPNDEFTATITLFTVPIWQSTYSMTKDIKEKNQLSENFDPRVILVLDPITFCSSGVSTSCSCFGPCPPGTTLQCNPVSGQCCTTSTAPPPPPS